MLAYLEEVYVLLAERACVADVQLVMHERSCEGAAFERRHGQQVLWDLCQKRRQVTVATLVLIHSLWNQAE
jgi:hypothetical protein